MADIKQIPIINSEDAAKTKNATLTCRWNCCEKPCDGYDCQFGIRETIPVQVLEPLGEGRHGWVTKVECRRSRRVMACKRIRWCFRKDVLRQIQNEVNIMRSLSHRHIVKVVGSYIEGNTFYSILLEPVAEYDLQLFLDVYFEEASTMSSSTSLRAGQSASTALVSSKSEEILLSSFGCLSSALAFIHSQSKKHKDIKPRNILVHNGSVLFTDFGIASDFSNNADSISEGPLACTPIWAAPEVTSPEGKAVGRASDIFSLGCVFVEIFTVLALKSIMEFNSYLADGGSECFSQNIPQVYAWLDTIEPKFKKEGRAFLNFVRKMIAEEPSRRPAASAVWDVAQSTPRDDRGFFCGDCCRERNLVFDPEFYEDSVSPTNTDYGRLMSSSPTASIERQIGRPTLSVTSASIMLPEPQRSNTYAISDLALNISSVGLELESMYQIPYLSADRDLFQNYERDTAALVMSRKRSGGRQLGEHLRPEAAKDAHKMRKIGACWHCVLQRDRCSPREICERCVKRSHPSFINNINARLGCYRLALHDLAPQFLPAILRHPYQESEVQKCWTNRIESWRTDRKYVLTLSWNITPPLVEENVQEGVLIKAPLTGVEYPKKKSVQEIALGLDLSHGSTGSKYSQYISSVIYTGIGDLPFALYPGTSECNVLYRELLTRVFGYYECTGNETLAEMAKLLIMTHCFTHSPSLLRSIPNLQSIIRNTPLAASDNLGLDFLYHQIKSHLALIQSTQLDLLLKRCNTGLRASKTAHLSKGLPLILTFIGLAMTLEQVQVALHHLLVGHEGDQAEQEETCRHIDQGIDMVLAICRLKYGARPKTHFQHRNAIDGDSAETTLALNLDGLISKHAEFLSHSAQIKLSVGDPSLYLGRLSSKFLLWFGEISQPPLQ